MLKKRKNNKNTITDEEAPILKRKSTNIPKQTQETPKFKQRIVRQQPVEKKSAYSQFLSKFNQKTSQNVNVETQQNNNYPKIDFVDKDTTYSAFESHFNLDQSKIQDKILEESSQKSRGLDEKLQHLLKAENQRDETLVLNNNVEFKNFSMKKELKKQAYFQSEYHSKWLLDQNVQESLKNNKINKSITMSQKQSVLDNYQETPFTEQEKEKYRFMSEYYDILQTDPEEKEKVNFRRLTVFHILNHLAAINSSQQHHGYTKCKVFILCCTKSLACDVPFFIQYIDEIVGLYTNGKTNRIQNAEKFEEEYANEDKGQDDNFKIGLSFKENIVKLYESFGYADIIIASPLAMKLHLEQQTHFAFLSSVEIVVLDDAVKAYNQNWAHVQEIFAHLNMMPKHQDITQDFELIRPYYFDNLQKFYRQTIIYTENMFPELSKIRNKNMSNYKGTFLTLGCIQNKPFYENPIEDQDVCVEYMKFDIENYKDEIEKRFEFFINKIWSKIMDDQHINQTAIVTNNYIEYVKLRNHFKKTNAFVIGINEYTKKGKVQKKIAQIMRHGTPFLLFNERAYYFNVCRLKRMKNIIFYSPPKNAFIFREMIETLQSDTHQGPSLHNKISCLFSNYDQMYIERLVGSKQSLEFFKNYNKSTTFIV